MSDDDELIALIDFVYAAVLDGDLWPTVLAKLAEATGTMQSIIATMDHRTNSFDSISRRTIAELDASYKNYWAFHNPLWAKTSALPAGQVWSFDSLMTPQDFAKTPIFNEWWKPADYGLAMLGANLMVEDQVSSLICVVNARGHDAPTSEQSRIFELAVHHIDRALRLHRQLWTLDHMHGATPERFEGLRQGAILVDAAANVLFINAAARTVLEAGDGLVLKGGCLATTDGADTLQRLIASCARAVGRLQGPLGGELEVRRGPRRPALGLVVTPLRTKNPDAGIPWLGLRVPVAIVTMADPEINRRRLAQDLHVRFGLTAAEAGLAAEIVKGDGREAAAKRRGISVATARAQLSSIFEKTGTHRQANSSISCSNSPAKEAQKNGSSNHIASSRGDLQDNGLLNGQEAGHVPAGGTETAKGDRRFIIRLQQEMNQFFMWGSARKWQSRACIVRSSDWPKLRPKVGESHEDMFEVGFGHGHRSRRPRFHRRVRLGHAAKRT